MPLHRRQRENAPAMLLFAILAFLAASIPSFHATPLTTQLTVEMEAHTDNNSTNEIESHTTRTLQLFPIAIPDFGDSNSTSCPPECPLCQCNSTEDADCLLTKSIEACASNSYETCYADILPGDFDIQGLCNVQCDKPAEDIPSSSREVCRICSIFACCNECPSERAGECFPPPSDDGYTPMGWEPATCSSGGVGRRGVGAAGLSLIMAVSFAAFGLFT
mmetsp:Transcript_30337/g.54944  ORF Transcript_30337/g.54944 Transcript_30337/m.54944 type:complete len:219 (+) Transcript_30337:140-796(+)